MVSITQNIKLIDEKLIINDKNDGDQHIVYSTRIFNKDEYISLAKLLSFGVFKPKIEKIDK